MESALFLGVALLLGHTVKGITGFGSRLVAIPLLSFLLSPVEAIALCTVSDLCTGGYLYVGVRHLVRWPVVMGMLLTALVGQACGLYLQQVLEPDVVRFLIAILVLFFALRLKPQPLDNALHTTHMKRMGGLAGFGSGAMGGLVGASGPPAVFFMNRYFGKEEGRAQLLAFFLLTSTTLTIALFQQEMVGVDLLRHLPVAIGASLVGAHVGSLLMPRIPIPLFTRGVSVLLIATSVTMMVNTLF